MVKGVRVLLMFLAATSSSRSNDVTLSACVLVTLLLHSTICNVRDFPREGFLDPPPPAPLRNERIEYSLLEQLLGDRPPNG